MRRIYFLSDLPSSVNGISCETDTGYIIAINSTLPIEEQAQALRHEIAHRELGHHRSDRSLDEIEDEASSW